MKSQSRSNIRCLAPLEVKQQSDATKSVTFLLRCYRKCAMALVKDPCYSSSVVTGLQSAAVQLKMQSDMTLLLMFLGWEIPTHKFRCESFQSQCTNLHVLPNCHMLQTTRNLKKEICDQMSREERSNSRLDGLSTYWAFYHLPRALVAANHVATIQKHHGYLVVHTHFAQSSVF